MLFFPFFISHVILSIFIHLFLSFYLASLIIVSFSPSFIHFLSYCLTSFPFQLCFFLSFVYLFFSIPNPRIICHYISPSLDFFLPANFLTFIINIPSLYANIISFSVQYFSHLYFLTFMSFFIHIFLYCNHPTATLLYYSFTTSFSSLSTYLLNYNSQHPTPPLLLFLTY